jgi:hypothetical protein
MWQVCSNLLSAAPALRGAYLHLAADDPGWPVACKVAGPFSIISFVGLYRCGVVDSENSRVVTSLYFIITQDWTTQILALSTM